MRRAGKNSKLKRPTYGYLIHPADLIELKYWRIQQAADYFHVNASSISRWKKKHNPTQPNPSAFQRAEELVKELEIQI